VTASSGYINCTGDANSLAEYNYNSDNQKIQHQEILKGKKNIREKMAIFSMEFVCLRKANFTMLMARLELVWK
jgi:hypothetical protein